MDYSNTVIEHFMCPRNVGSMPDADAEGTYGDTNCGDFLNVYLKVENDIIKEISYLVFGCAAAVASSSMMSVLAQGKMIEEALLITNKDIDEALDGLPANKLHCSVLGAKALRNAIDNYLMNRQKKK
ncbi:MAG: iron-sulfur cluster assembly scaffold protein [Gracilibacter sp. BRH_c7a]|nr:MAG: iron-sulfur cluster assembly scaffold protein [Gracilibacter sp. BRH_c7a]